MTFDEEAAEAYEEVLSSSFASWGKDHEATYESLKKQTLNAINLAKAIVLIDSHVDLGNSLPAETHDEITRLIDSCS